MNPAGADGAVSVCAAPRRGLPWLLLAVLLGTSAVVQARHACLDLRMPLIHLHHYTSWVPSFVRLCAAKGGVLRALLPGLAGFHDQAMPQVLPGPGIALMLAHAVAGPGDGAEYGGLLVLMSLGGAAFAVGRGLGGSWTGLACAAFCLWLPHTTFHLGLNPYEITTTKTAVLLSWLGFAGAMLRAAPPQRGRWSVALAVTTFLGVWAHWTMTLWLAALGLGLFLSQPREGRWKRLVPLVPAALASGAWFAWTLGQPGRLAWAAARLGTPGDVPFLRAYGGAVVESLGRGNAPIILAFLLVSAVTWSLRGRRGGAGRGPCERGLFGLFLASAGAAACADVLSSALFLGFQEFPEALYLAGMAGLAAWGARWPVHHRVGAVALCGWLFVQHVRLSVLPAWDTAAAAREVGAPPRIDPNAPQVPWIGHDAQREVAGWCSRHADGLRWMVFDWREAEVPAIEPVAKPHGGRIDKRVFLATRVDWLGWYLEGTGCELSSGAALPLLAIVSFPQPVDDRAAPVEPDLDPAVAALLAVTGGLAACRAWDHEAGHLYVCLDPPAQAG